MISRTFIAINRQLCVSRSVRATRKDQVQWQRAHNTFCFPVCPPPPLPCFWSTMSNGVRVCTECSTSPLACVAVYIEAGSRYEESCNNGACHFFEHLAFKSFMTLNKQVFEEDILCKGINFTAHTDREYQVFRATGENDKVEIMIQYLAQMFTGTCFCESLLEVAKQEVYEKLKNVENDPKQLTFDYLHQTAFQGTPLALSPIGPSYNYNVFNAQFLTAFVAQHYQPFRMILSVSSCYNHQCIVRMVSTFFGRLRQTTNELVNWPCRYSGSMVRYRDDLIPYLHFCFALECSGVRSKDYISLNVMKHMIGKWDVTQHQKYATSPALAQAFAEGGLCSYYECFYLPYMDVGLFGLYCIVHKDIEVEDTLYQIQDKLMNLCLAPTRGDLQRGHNSYIKELARQRTGGIHSCHDMALQILYFGKRYTMDELLTKISVTREDRIHELADKVIHDRCPVVVGVGPTESIPEYNKIRNGMYLLRL